MKRPEWIDTNTTRRIGTPALLLTIILYFIAPEYWPVDILTGVITLWLPGTLILSELGYFKRKRSLADLYAAPLVTSVLVLIPITVGFVYASFSLRYIPLIPFAAGIGLLLEPPTVSKKPKYSNTDTALTGIALALSVLFIYFPHIGNNRVTLSFHGAWHSAVTYNILQGSIPPTNPAFAWVTAKVYWPYHILLASLTGSLEITPVEAALGLNILSAIGVIVVLRETIQVSLTDPTWRHRFIALVSVLLGLTAVGPLFRYFLGYRVWDQRITTFLQKFINISSFPIGIFIFCYIIYLFILVRKGSGGRKSNGCLLIAAVVALFHIHTTTALFVIPALLVASIVSIWFEMDGSQRIWRVSQKWVLIWGTAGILTLPFFFHIVNISSSGSTIMLTPPDKPFPGADKLPSIFSSVPNPALYYIFNLANLGLPYLLFIPSVCIGINKLWNDPKASGSPLILFTIGGVMAFLGVVIFLTHGNQYKVAYLVILPICPVISIGTIHILQSINTGYKTVLSLSIILLLMTAPVTVIQADYLNNSRFNDRGYQFQGSDIALSNESTPKAGTLEWIQKNTPTNSALIFTPEMYRESNYSPSPSEMIFSAVSQRSLFYGEDAMYKYALRYPSASSRKATRARLSTCSGDLSVSESIQIRGPIYTVIKLDERRKCNLLKKYRASHRWREVHSIGNISVFKYTR